MTSPALATFPSFDPDGLEHVRARCRAAVERGYPAGMALVVAQRGAIVLNEAWGTVERLEDGAAMPASPDTVWLSASITKPVVCAGVCLLLERGELLLDDPVSCFIPEFNGRDRAGVTLRHLLTHSSGLPDMLPENIDLRKTHAGLEQFVARTCATPLLFQPGTQVSYQSMGIALLGEIIQRVSGVTCAEFLRREFFQPLGMTHCDLGLSPELRPLAARVQLPDWQEPGDWNWNSAYWRELGAPWGGMHSTAPQLARFLLMLAAGGAWEGRRFLSPAATREMLRNQTADLPLITRPASTWGLGWRHMAARESLYFGDLLSQDAWGHAGATGTVAWHDPRTDLTMALLSNQPGCERFLAQIGNAVAASATVAGEDCGRA